MGDERIMDSIQEEDNQHYEEKNKESVEELKEKITYSAVVDGSFEETDSEHCYLLRLRRTKKSPFAAISLQRKRNVKSMKRKRKKKKKKKKKMDVNADGVEELIPEIFHGMYGVRPVVAGVIIIHRMMMVH
jgi:hypothetical protein